MKRVWSGVAALVCVAALVACAVPDATRGEVGRFHLALPPATGAWTEIPVGAPFEAPSAVLGPDATMPLRTRAWGLPGPDGAWQAVVFFHVGNAAGVGTSWRDACPSQRGVVVHDAADGSAARIDCLRLRRWATVEDWLTTYRPDLAQWQQQQQVRFSGAPALVSHMFTNAGGEFLMVDVLADGRLLRPETRSNDAFLRAGLPAEAWGERLAQAVRQATGMVDGHLAVPAFPFSVTTN